MNEIAKLLPGRPGGAHYKSFRDIQILTNHYRVALGHQEKVWVYRVRFTPSIPYENCQLHMKLLQKAMPTLRSCIDSPVISGLTIYSLKAPFQPQCVVEVDDYIIDVKLVKELNVRENPFLLLALLNNALRNTMDRLGFMEIGKSSKFFSGENRIKIEELYMYSGYSANFHRLQGGLYLRVDSAKKIVRNETVLDKINSIYQQHRDKEKEYKRHLLEQALIGTIVMTNYGKTRYFRVQELRYDDLSTMIIEGQSLTIPEYYQTKYDITLKNLKQPLLKAENKKTKIEILLVPELCLMTGIPDHFDEFARKKISEHTIKDAGTKKRQIDDLLVSLKGRSEINSLKEIQIDLTGQMERITAKLIPTPRLALGQKCSVQEGREAMFNLFNKPLFNVKHSLKCAVIGANTQQLESSIRTFKDTAKKLGVDLQVLKLTDGCDEKGRMIGTIEQHVKKAVKEGCNMCFIVIPNNMKNKYKDIKDLTLRKNDILSQIAVEGTLRKKNLQSIATKILLQMIAKRGNTLWVPESSHNVQGSLLIGFDYGKIGSDICVSACASINSTFSSFFSRSVKFTGQQNKFPAVRQLILESVSAYAERNKAPPINIIGYHKSVCGDQIRLFHDFCIQPLLSELQNTFGSNKPKLIMVMVNGKTNERFFTTGEARNVNAGTLINRGVTSDNYDFYLVSQGSNRGCTVPNHYSVIYNDSNLEEGQLEQLSFSQCFNYVNWTGSIKIPGVLQYAKKCSKFYGEVLCGDAIGKGLENKLYYV